MFRRINALLWSRMQMILANKMISIYLVMPILMVVLYQYMFKGREGMENMILFMVLPMVPAFLGYLLPTVLGEEAEKNNQRSLRLAGVKSWEYVLASLMIPFLVNLVYLIVLPFYLQVDWDKLGWQYIPVMLATTMVVFFIFMGFALVSDTQARATIGAMPIMMVTMLLPMFSMLDKTVEKIIGFTYLGSYSVYSQKLVDYQLSDKSFLFLLLWLVASILAVVWLTRQKQVIR
ncbi:ABC transporter permease [Streptococcus minor]|uniref:ABC transporter permease n=1 Tax=Streptococcus minor TaxID=229549 RepID=A0A3P1VG10_9STRE|nr:ABC transporter permease [Streptococcus minor]RRD32586.1 ABC transporter permease [Streptococcus minor]